MTDIAELGIIIESSGAVKGAQALDGLAISAGKAERATDRVTMSSQKVGKATGLASHQSRMMAMQLSQVAQQASATGNWVQALAIQLPDMALGFGTIGIAAGVLAGVALPLLANAFLGSSEEAKTLDERLKDLARAVADYRSAADEAASSAATLTERFGTQAAAVQKTLELLRDIELAKSMDSLNGSLNEIDTSRLTLLVDIVKDGQGEIDAFNDNFKRANEELQSSFGLSAQSAQSVLTAIEAMKAARGPEQIAESARKLNAELLAAFGTVQKMPAEFRDMAENAARADTAASGIIGTMEAVAKATGAAVRVAADLADNYGAAARAFAEFNRQSQADSMTYGKVGARGDPRKANQQGGFVYSGPSLDSSNNVITRGGGGGGGGADTYKTELSALVESLQSERETVDAWYAESQAILADRRAMEILGAQGHKEAMLEVERLYQEQLAEIAGNSQDKQLGELGSFFGAMQGIAISGGKGMAKAAATFGAVEGTINAYRAALQAYADPTVGFWGKFAAYASVLAAGLKGVQAIRAAGGIGGGGVAAQGTTAQAAPQAQSRLIVQGIRKDDLFTGSMLFEMLGEEFDRRGIEFI